MEGQVDQAERLEAFEASHPDTEIRKPDYANGGRLWSAHRGGLVLCAEGELKALLDRCEWLLSQPDGGIRGGQL